jgi:hypothetical protein
MKRIRFNIATLLVVVLFVAVGFAGLRQADEMWDSGLFTVTIGVLLISILVAIHRPEKRRAFWLGFALLRSAYLGLCLVPSIESRLITTRALAYLDSKVVRRSIELYAVLDTGTRSVTGNNQVSNVTLAFRAATAGQGRLRLWNGVTCKPLGGWSGTTQSFVRIGHSLLSGGLDVHDLRLPQTLGTETGHRRRSSDASPLIACDPVTP